MSVMDEGKFENLRYTLYINPKMHSAQEISQKNLQQEKKYSSFILAQTKSKQLSQKWPYYILSLNGQILMNTEEPTSDTPPTGQDHNSRDSKYEYNIGVDAFCCSLGHSKFVLAEGDWMWQCFTDQERKLLVEVGYCRFDAFQLAANIEFYYYLKDSNENSKKQSQFLKLTPTYYVSTKTLIFTIVASETPSTQSVLRFKPLNPKETRLYRQESRKEMGTSYTSYYNYKSDYAVLSDQHFWNCLVRGVKPIGCYQRTKHGYFFVMGQNLFNILKSLNIQPKI